jgi:Polysaccharide lyase
MNPSVLLRSVLGALALSTTFLLSVGMNQPSAKIIDSVHGNQNKAELGKGGDACQKIETTSAVKRSRQKVFKHWVDRCGERAELSMKATEIGKTYWYGWSMLVPSDWKDTTKGSDIFAQWATYPSPRNGKFPCSANGSFMERIKGTDAVFFRFQRQGNNTDSKCDSYPLAKISAMRGKWVDFVMHSKWTGNKDGFLKLWMKIGDEPYVQKINYTGRTFWNDEGRGPYFKMGLYKGEPGFKGPAPRYLYTDEYRLGNANSSFEQVAPRGFRIQTSN